MSLRICTRSLLPRLRSGLGPSVQCQLPRVTRMTGTRAPVISRLIQENSNYSVRNLHITPRNLHGEYEWKDPERDEDIVMITVYNKEGKVDYVRGKVGDNLLYLCKRFEVDMEGACEASLACTTCHVYVDHEYLDTLSPPTETEEDLLDAAPFLRDNSRLGCQIILSKVHEGMVLRLPAATKNFYVDGHKPSHH